MSNSQKPAQVPLKNILGYGAAALGYNMVYTLVFNFVNVFFTNVLGLGLAAVGTIMLVARVWDGVNDPIMGSIVDKTHNQRGKYRPYILWGILPLSTMTMLMFLNVGGSLQIKTMYAATVYILWGMAYTFANIPYMSMQSTLSTNSNERTKIIAIKNIFVMIGAMTPVVIVPMLAFDKDGANPQGFFTASILIVGILVISMLITYKATEPFKYVTSNEDTKKISHKERMQAIFGNKPLLLTSLVLLSFSIASALQGAQTYWVLNVLNQGDKVLLVSMAMLPGMIIAMALTPIAMKFEKRSVMLLGGIIFTLSSILIYFVPQANFNLFLLLVAVRGFGLGFCSIFIWSMITDCVDYATLKTGKQQGGIVFSASTFMQKCAGGVGGALLNFGLAFFGFVATAESQTTTAIHGVKIIMSFGFAVFGVIMIGALIPYNLNKKRMQEISAILQADSQEDLLKS